MPHKPARLCVILLLGIAAATGSAQGLVPVADDELAQELADESRLIGNRQSPGIAMMAGRYGRILLRASSGDASLAERSAVTPATPVRIGTITTQLTAAAILLMVEEGKLSLTDAIHTFLPSLHQQWRGITVEHLLTHTSGIAVNKRTPRLHCKPGTCFVASPANYLLLGAIIEKVSGQRYAQFVGQRIAAPLGMGDTKADPATVVTAYDGMLSTVDDLGRWWWSMSSGKLLSAASWALMQRNHRMPDGAFTGHGYGWEIAPHSGGERLEHSSDSAEYSATVQFQPKNGIFVAVLSNAGNTAVQKAARRVGWKILRRTGPGRMVVRPVPGTLWEYGGTYQSDAGKLYIEAFIHGLQVSYDRACYVDGLALNERGNFFGNPGELHFERDGDGKITQLVRIRDQVETVYQRVLEAPAPAVTGR